MGFAVFLHRSDSIYDDSPAERYQFPKNYLGRVAACVGDWIVYLEPGSVRGTRGYFAIARVQQIVPDPKAQGLFLALIEAGSYVPFPSPVPFNAREGPVERGLLNEQRKLSGRAQSAVRPLSESDFRRIVMLGLDDDTVILPRVEDIADQTGFSDEQTPFNHEEPRDRILQLASRVVRDRLFRRIVLRAYNERCAITGLKLINGGGRAEVAAAHIRPVEASGPDIINNGIALSGTAHWMFERGLIGLSDDLEIMISRHVNNYDDVRSFVRPEGIALPPSDPRDRPQPGFLKWHRENIYKN